MHVVPGSSTKNDSDRTRKWPVQRLFDENTYMYIVHGWLVRFGLATPAKNVRNWSVRSKSFVQYLVPSSSCTCGVHYSRLTQQVINIARHVFCSKTAAEAARKKNIRILCNGFVCQNWNARIVDGVDEITWPSFVELAGMSSTMASWKVIDWRKLFRACALRNNKKYISKWRTIKIDDGATAVKPRIVVTQKMLFHFNWNAEWTYFPVCRLVNW